jgi:hypothetical protein
MPHADCSSSQSCGVLNNVHWLESDQRYLSTSFARDAIVYVKLMEVRRQVYAQFLEALTKTDGEL